MRKPRLWETKWFAFVQRLVNLMFFTLIWKPFTLYYVGICYIYPPTHPLIQPPVHPPIHSPIHPFVHPSTHPCIHHPFIHSSTHPYIHPPISPSAHPSILYKEVNAGWVRQSPCFQRSPTLKFILSNTVHIWLLKDKYKWTITKWYLKCSFSVTPATFQVLSRDLQPLHHPRKFYLIALGWRRKRNETPGWKHKVVCGKFYEISEELQTQSTIRTIAATTITCC